MNKSSGTLSEHESASNDDNRMGDVDVEKGMHAGSDLRRSESKHSKLIKHEEGVDVVEVRLSEHKGVSEGAGNEIEGMGESVGEVVNVVSGSV